MQPNNRSPEDRPEDRPEGQGLCHKVDREGRVTLCLDRQEQVVPCLDLEYREEQVAPCPECCEVHKERVLR